MISQETENPKSLLVAKQAVRPAQGKLELANTTMWDVLGVFSYLIQFIRLLETGFHICFQHFWVIAIFRRVTTY